MDYYNSWICECGYPNVNMDGDFCSSCCRLNYNMDEANQECLATYHDKLDQRLDEHLYAQP